MKKNKTGLKRDTIDKFYTKKDIVHKCIKKIKKILLLAIMI
jgi:hypothetical protein